MAIFEPTDVGADAVLLAFLPGALGNSSADYGC